MELPGTDGARPRNAHHGFNWEILGKPDVLRRLYEVEGWTAPEIAKAAGCERSTVLRWLRLYGIRVRRRGCRGGGEAEDDEELGPRTARNERNGTRKARGGEVERCTSECEGWEECLDDEGPCRYVAR